MVGNDVLIFGGPIVGTYANNTILSPVYYKEQIKPYKTARGLVGLLPHFENGKWGVLAVKTEPNSKKGK